MSSSPTTLVGNLTRDPEVTTVGSGTTKTTFSIACNHSWRNADGDWEEDVSYFNVIAWRALADDAAMLTQGTRVIATGRLDQRSYETNEGEKRTWIELVADDIAVSVKAIEGYDRKQRAENGNGNGAAKNRSNGGSTGGARNGGGARRRPAPADDFPTEDPF